MRSLAGVLCALALGALPIVGCSDDEGPGGIGGEGGRGGGGQGGAGGMSCPVLSCIQPVETCDSAAVDPIQPCCESPTAPTQEVACTGVESTENPSSCAPIGVASVYRLTSLQVAADCNAGFDLDGCYGHVCGRVVVENEGIDGVDNALATIEHSAAINQLFADALCGSDRTQGPDCEPAIERLDLELTIEANTADHCANVIIFAGDREVGRVILNLGDPTATGTRCASGALGPIPIALRDTEITLESWAASMTVSEAGISDGKLGAILSADDAFRLGEAASPGLGSVFSQMLDFFEGDWCGEEACNAVSGTYEFGGVAEPVH